jgi:hypothetical protein
MGLYAFSHRREDVAKTEGNGTQHQEDRHG